MGALGPAVADPSLEAVRPAQRRLGAQRLFLGFALRSRLRTHGEPSLQPLPSRSRTVPQSLPGNPSDCHGREIYLLHLQPGLQFPVHRQPAGGGGAGPSQTGSRCPHQGRGAVDRRAAFFRVSPRRPGLRGLHGRGLAVSPGRQTGAHSSYAPSTGTRSFGCRPPPWPAVPGATCRISWSSWSAMCRWPRAITPSSASSFETPRRED